MSLAAAKPSAPDLSGKALGGRYELHAVIGEGSFGRVYRGRDRRLARPVAVKVIKPWWGKDPDWGLRFEREAQLMARVSDPRIVQIFDVGDDDEGSYYVAELVEGKSLAQRLRSGPLSADQARDLAQQVSQALGAAHARRVVHGDVKPANVLITDTGKVKVADFGLARLMGGTTGYVAGTVGGTPTYMAPEQAHGRRITPASDVYSIGVILYEMLAGRPPFGGDSALDLALRHMEERPPPLPASVPAALRAVVENALAKDPENRYPNGGELATALAHARGATGGAVSPSRRVRAGAAWSKTQPNRPAKTLVAPRRGPQRNVNPAARRRTIAAFGVVLLVLVGMIAAAIATSAPRVRVPDLHGLTRAVLAKEVSRAHLRLELRSGYSLAPRGTVIAQAPAAGARVAGGSRVLAKLSAGPPPVSVPRVVGFSSADAQSTLHQLGMRIRLAEVAAPGLATGTVTAQHPSAGASLKPGSTVSLSVAEAPRWRSVLSFGDQGGQTSAPFEIRGNRWRIVYGMEYTGVCAFVSFFCSGPTANVVNVDRGTAVSSFGLSAGSDQVQTFSSGPGTYKVKISPGDSASWSAQVQDYY